ncbi:MAG TPA: hypothetical protein VFB12_02070, partial [Ktedonobacteraceae bacterium]|nr:hypothetical protein [Ktedonobacteraceae bacterium]
KRLDTAFRLVLVYGLHESTRFLDHPFRTTAILLATVLTEIISFNHSLRLWLKEIISVSTVANGHSV